MESMPQFKIHFFCNECGQTHPLPMRLELDKVLIMNESIGDVYAGEELPSNIASIINTKTVCPNTKKWTIQKDNNQIFLVPD